MMPAAFQKLDKILRLERNQGYKNRAVIGGLEHFAELWQQEAQAEAADDEQIQLTGEIATLLEKYAEADREAREETVDEILGLLDPDAARTQPGHPPPLQKPGIQTPRNPDAPGKVTREPIGPTVVAERPASGLEAPVSSLPGISTAYAARLQRLGIHTVGELLYHFPHRYEDYRSLKAINRLEYGEETTIIGTVWDTKSRPTRGGGTIISAIIADASGTIEATWFNQPYLTQQLRSGRQIVVSGKVEEYLGRLIFRSPAWEPLEQELIHTARLVPIYPLTSGLTSRWMRRMTKRVVDYWAPRLEDPLPASLRERARLVDLSTALRQIHFPENQQRADEARRRLSFDEFFLIQLGLLNRRQEWQHQAGSPIQRNQELLESFLDSLPFQLTSAQQEALDQILKDLAQPKPMSRLLQGDVGSGKTVVGMAAMLMTHAAGKQSALMAPTEILAEQHYQTISRLLVNSQRWAGLPSATAIEGKKIAVDEPISVVLLTGSMGRAERNGAIEAISAGRAAIVVGTHALIQRGVTFEDLGLVIVDEQHRFGVLQRSTLRGKGSSPHMLVMSATPIPRSLALTLYGDLEISVIDQLPPGRLPIETRWLLPKERERAYAFLRSQIEKGRQAFILYPLIQESDKVEARAAVEEYERLQSSVFPDLRLGLLHGRMATADKDRVMAEFRSGEIDILVSTSVVEVGIDVPNTTALLIEGADRFGLAQLHQFRGRVGRGGHQSYCLLLSDTASPDNPQTKSTWERLRAIEETQDGFVLAEKDLELRGPGDFFGVRQSGLPTLRLASLSNVRVLEQARSEALALFQEDPGLSKPEHRRLAEQVSRFWQTKVDHN